jgi:hypothetical protein
MECALATLEAVALKTRRDATGTATMRLHDYDSRSTEE